MISLNNISWIVHTTTRFLMKGIVVYLTNMVAPESIISPYVTLKLDACINFLGQICTVGDNVWASKDYILLAF